MNKHIETLREILQHTETRCFIYEQRIRDGDADVVQFLEVAKGDALALTYAIAVVEAAEKWAGAHAVFDTTYVNFKDKASVDAANEVLRVSRDTSEKLLAIFSEGKKEVKPDA